jgi:hypothetical protein|tara:strand:+ start:1011 stop:1355 length:345 start_codon:yes stop_codon:yes gene_type:complete
MRFDIKKEDGKVIVEVELLHQRRHYPIIARQRFQTEDVLKELESRGVKHGKAIQTANVKNWREHTRQGTWIFEEKATKTLDKPAEKVILEVEKKETIANKPKAKKKSTRKKKAD